MAFPTTSLLDAFTYAEGNLSTLNATDWATPIVSGDVDWVVASGGVLGYNSGGQSPSAFWNHLVGPDTELTIDIATTESNWLILFARITNPGGASLAGYVLYLNPGTGEIALGKYAAGTYSEIERYEVTTFASGDSVGMEVKNSGSDVQISIYKKLSGGSWAGIQIHDAGGYVYTDSAPGGTYTGQGYIGIRGDYWGYFGGRLDNFGGGTIGEVPLSPLAISFMESLAYG